MPRSQPCPAHQTGRQVHRGSLCGEISQEIDLAKTIQRIFEVIIWIYRKSKKFVSINYFLSELSGVCPGESPDWKVQL